ncbi:MAG: hypothetical protein LKJ21_04220 [Oscillospiraceae bacterium]|nr:hypothetical protein [Oscillospiraceae bacterium]MCI1989953.1 hypothetical protein [Oscillospiraceae bacterium]MCI2034983.1 hypothetical protein [Oscillospiraceae bacterium]
MVTEPTGKAGCPCPRLKCRRHGDCAECRKQHRRIKKPPYCDIIAKTGEGKK